MKTIIKSLIVLLLLLVTQKLLSQDYEAGMLYIYVQDQNAIPVFNYNNEEIDIILQDTDLKTTFENYEVYAFHKAFPLIDSISLDYKYELERVYLLQCNGNEVDLMNMLNDEFSIYYDFIEQLPVYYPVYTPNDYHLLDNILGHNYALDIINAKQAWDITKGCPTVILGITDTGFWTDHEDLEDKIEIVFGNGSGITHGTAVAGIAGADTDNGIGMSSIGFNCKLGLGLGSAGFSGNTGYNTLLEMAHSGIKVANASWASLSYSQTHQNNIHAITDLGLLVVASAGNGPAQGLPPNDYRYPASYDRVMSVTSVGSDYKHKCSIDSIAHTHNDKVDVSAPGYYVIYTDADPNLLYWKGSGTSFASPFVTGLAGLALTIKPDLQPHHLAWIIKSTTQNIDNLNQEYLGLIGTGLIDAYAAVMKTEQLANETADDYDIYNGQIVIWADDEIKIIDNYIHIHPGGSLTIRGDVYLQEDAIIIVEPGASLHLDGAYLTNYDVGNWHGIEVWGNYFIDQSPKINQGFLNVFNHSIIENANYAVTIGKRENGVLMKYFGGGILHANNSTFQDNLITIEFSNYTRPSSTIPLPNISHINKCDFLREKALDHPSLTPTFITLNSVNGIEILGCTFKNTHISEQVPNQINSGIGILAFHSSFKVGSYENLSETTDSYFFNLHYGIKAQGTNPISELWVENVIFDKLFQNIYTKACNNAVIINNTFYLLNGIVNPMVSPSYGVYLDHCTGYRIEYNDFLKWMDSPQLRKVIGIIVNNSGPDYNMIYNNYFDKLYIGILAQNHNRGFSEQPYTGLVIKCNDFYRNHYDVSVTGDDYLPHYGIGVYQGVPLGVDGPAGNLFGHWRPGSTSDFHNEMQHINYIHHSPSDPRLVPIYYTESTISLIDALEPWNMPLACPILLPEDEEEMKALIIDSEEEASESKNMLAALVDHGDTYQLETDVLFSNAAQSFDIYNHLLDAEGKLSTEVLAAAIQKEDVLHDAMIRDILVDNPHSAKSDELMFLLENRMNQLPEFMLAQIDQGYNLLSSKDMLESNIAANELMASLLSNALIRLYKADTVNTVTAFNRLTEFLAQRQTPVSYYRLAFEYLNAGQINDATATMLSIGNFNLSVPQAELHNRMTSYFNLLKDLKMQERNIYELQTEEVDILNGLSNGNDLVAAYARSILIANNLLDYQEEIILPVEGIKSSRLKRNAVMPDNKLSVYPNPASNYFIVSYNTGNAGNQSNLLIISDLTGRIVKSFELGNNPSDQQIVPIQGINKGVYICTLFSNRQLISNAKLIVN